MKETLWKVEQTKYKQQCKAERISNFESSIQTSSSISNSSKIVLVGW